ncbi:Uncharacterised protein [Ectopseudomonas mendocina]|uniref:Uncharacterized protein n=1 Tax=Ectopseudomonas mendocina TaxID=300 RepID=A0A379PLY4_ECTME|nr:hypothetical protein [Pseudomonas mendocina]SUE95777.1 Uncharacterised protein [Pseudomonas mendocina]
MKFYVGCGSTEAPPQILKLINRLAGVMSDRGFFLRASFQQGPDKEFRQGSRGKFFTYLSEEDFKGDSICGIPPDLSPGGASSTLARKLNPMFVMLPEAEKRWEIVANEVVLGSSGGDLAKLLITWTPDGATKPDEFTERTGHVARYLTLADRFGVPVMNLARREHRDKALSWLGLKNH